jgi:HTH-type transcriptional regulator/antitoxin HigA
MDIKPIKTDADHEAALAEIERLMDLEPDLDTPDGDRLDVLAILVEVYEATHFPIDAPDPVAAIEFCMEQRGLTRKDLEPMVGGRSRVSEVLSGKRRLSLSMIRNLHRGLGIPAEVLLREPDADHP